MLFSKIFLYSPFPNKRALLASGGSYNLSHVLLFLSILSKGKPLPFSLLGWFSTVAVFQERWPQRWSGSCTEFVELQRTMSWSEPITNTNYYLTLLQEFQLCHLFTTFFLPCIVSKISGGNLCGGIFVIRNMLYYLHTNGYFEIRKTIIASEKKQRENKEKKTYYVPGSVPST